MRFRHCLSSGWRSCHRSETPRRLKVAMLKVAAVPSAMLATAGRLLPLRLPLKILQVMQPCFQDAGHQRQAERGCRPASGSHCKAPEKC